MSTNILPPSGVSDGASLIVRLRDAVKAAKNYRNLLSGISRQCDAVLSTVEEYSPLLIGTPAGIEADAIKRAVERILGLVWGWTRLSDMAAFLRQNEIRAGIDGCHRELATRADKLTTALLIMNGIGGQIQHLAQQRDHGQLVDTIASLREELRKHSRSIGSEAEVLQLGETPQVLEADGEQSVTPDPSHFRSADISRGVSKVSEQGVIEGSLLVFYFGGWTDDRDPTALGRLRDQSPVSQMCFKERIEASISLQHEHILGFFGYITIEDNVYSVNPWMENGNMREYIRVNPGADRMRLLGEVASGVEFLHRAGIVHGDLCGKNIMINGDGKAVVCGFGLSECSNPTLDLYRARWFAPERIMSTSITLPTEEGDSWSFGSLSLEVFAGEDPYNLSTALYVPVLLSQGVTPEHPGSKAVGLSPNMWELVQSCWKIDPLGRPSMYTIRSTIHEMRPPHDSHQHSSSNSEPSVPTPGPLTNDTTVPAAETSHQSATGSSPLPQKKFSVVTGIPPFVIRELNLLAPTLPIRTVGHQIGAQLETGYSKRVSDTSSSISGRLPPLDDPLNSNPGRRLSGLQFPSVPGRRSQSYPSTNPSPSTASGSAPSLPPLPQSDLPRQSNVDYSSYSTSTTGEPDTRLRWPFRSPNRSRTTFNASPSFQTPVHLTPRSTISAEASYKSARSSPMSLTQRSPPPVTPGTNPSAPTPPIRTAEHQTQVQTGYSRRVSDGPSSALGLFPPLLEVPLNPNMSVPLSPSSLSMSRTNESSPRRRWPFGGPKRAPKTLTTFPSVHDKPLRTQSITTKVPNAVASQDSSAAVLLPQSRKWESASPAVLESLEKVASDPEGFLRPGVDGSVSVGNLEGLVSRVISGTADKVKDARYMATFLTVYLLFATSERLFKILKQRFRPIAFSPANVVSRYNILLFVESWLKKGFEDEELECSVRIKDFALAVTGSVTMRTKAQEIVSLIDNSDNIHLRQPGSCARLRCEPAERPPRLTPADLAAALTAVEADRFKYIVYWDYVNFARGRPDIRRIEMFNTVHDLVMVWVKRTILHSNDTGKQIKVYEEWIYTAQECRNMNNFSSTAAIVIALTSPIITALALTRKSKAKPILHALARELTPKDGVYENTLQQAMTNDLIPWLDPLLSSLNSAFAHSNLIVEVDGHPLIDFKQCMRLAEQIDSLVQYTPPRVRSATRPKVLAYVEYSLESCVGDDVVRTAEARSAELVGEEPSLLHRWNSAWRKIGMTWSSYPQRRK